MDNRYARALANIVNFACLGYVPLVGRPWRRRVADYSIRLDASQQ
jgi:hypothetical protein